MLRNIRQKSNTSTKHSSPLDVEQMETEIALGL